MTKSLVTFIRKQLKIKGASEHNGRGAWICEANVSSEELYKRVQAQLPKWQERGLVLFTEEDEKWLTILFSKEFGHCYRTFNLNKRATGETSTTYVISFNIPDTEEVSA